MMNTANPELQLAEEFVRHTDRHVFLTGKAGTGKTTFLHEVRKNSPKRLVVTAPTGVAAINAGGVTLHSFFQLPFGPFAPGSEATVARQRIRREKRNIIRSLDLLIIDEISMVRADLLDGVDAVLRFCRRTDEPFGGVQLLLIGDLHQLPPVTKTEEWQLLQPFYDSPYFFSSMALARTKIIPMELKRIYRQSDHRFIELLGRVRDNSLDSASLQLLNSRCIPNFAPKESEGYVTLCTHNRNADVVNTAKMNALPGKGRNFNAEVEGEFPDQSFPTAAALSLKVGAQVMFVRNDQSSEKSYFNGKIGKITGIGADMIEVSCPGDSENIQVGKTTWDNIEYAIDPETAEISEKVIGTFRQYPLKPAWAITIHKSQGLTFDKAVIDARAAFAHGQVYVALSRCRTLEGLVMSAPLNPSAVKTDPSVQRFVAEVARFKPSPELLAAAKMDYQRKLMFSCFDFERLNRLIGRLNGLLLGNAGVIQISADREVSDVRKEMAADIFEVGEKFKRQLQGMFSDETEPVSDSAIQDRLRKACVYFQDKFSVILLPFLESLTVETDNKEIRKSINDATKQLREETATRLAGVRSCRDGFSPDCYLRAISIAALEPAKREPKPESVLYSEEQVGHPELFQSLREWRKDKAAEEGVAHFQILHQKTLVQIAVHLPDAIPALKKIKGIGKALARKYGEELIALVTDYRRKHRIETITLPEPAPRRAVPEKEAAPKVKENTKQKSFDLFNRGFAIPQIAAERGLAVSTIEGHLAHFVSTGELEIGRLIPEDKRRVIEEKIREMPEKPVGEIKAVLGEGYSYGEVKMVLSHLNHFE